MSSGLVAFTIFGIFSLAAVIIGILMFLFEKFKDFIGEMRYKHIWKHRFDKPPIAKCYCKDCEHWRSSDGWCFYFNNRCTAFKT